MIPTPFALPLTICDYVIVEQRTNKASLVGMFSTFRALSFPTTPLPFCVFAVLFGGRGEAEVTLRITNLADDEDLGEHLQRVQFADRFAEVYVLFRLAACTFPEPGTYEFSLLVDDDLVARRRARVLPVGEQP